MYLMCKGKAKAARAVPLQLKIRQQLFDPENKAITIQKSENESVERNSTASYTCPVVTLYPGRFFNTKFILAAHQYQL